jgi:DNA-binding transcriptional LysR family regulator
MGRTLLGHANRILAEAEAAETEARGGTQRPSGLIRIAAPMTFGIGHLFCPLFSRNIQTLILRSISAIRSLIL